MWKIDNFTKNSAANDELPPTPMIRRPLARDVRKDLIADAIADLFGSVTIVERNDAALVDARRSARKLRRFEQASDHPVLPTLPETEYFKGFLLEMVPGR